MHDTVTEAGCKQKHCNKPKTHWCPELSPLRSRKRFWWRLWNDNDRPRAGAVYETYKYIKKVFRRRIRQCVDRSVNNKYQKLNVMLKNRKLYAFWNVIIKEVKAISYIAQYPVLRTAQSALHFTSLTDLFTQTPSRLIWEASSHMLQLMREGCSYTYPPLSVARYSFYSAG